MRMEMKDGEPRLEFENNSEWDLVEALVVKRYGPTLEALLTDIRPVFMKHGLDADDPHFIEQGLCDLIRDKLWTPAKEEVLIGGRF